MASSILKKNILCSFMRILNNKQDCIWLTSECFTQQVKILSENRQIYRILITLIEMQLIAVRFCIKYIIYI